MNNNNADTMLQETDRRTLRGELALIAAVLINSFGVVLMRCGDFSNLKRAVCIFRSLY